MTVGEGVGALVHRLRPSAGRPAGALVLLHGRGVDESDLYPLLDAFDPERRLLGATPRAPLQLPPGGNRFAYNDRAARQSFGLPATGRISNGTVKTSVVGKGGAARGSSKSSGG